MTARNGRIAGIEEEGVCVRIEGVMPSCVDAKRIKFKAVNSVLN
jgi:hypothetical protein